MTNVVLLIVVGVFLAQPVVSLCSHYILLWITNWLRPPLQPPTAKPKEDTSLPPDIDKVCYSMLHAIEEHSRVLAHHSHVRGAIDVAYGVLQEQEDVIARHAFNQMRALRQKPWTFVVGRGASGIHTDKEVYCFRHHFGGMVVEIPSHSAGDIRMKNSAEGQILSCSGDGILFKRDSFFSPLLIQRLEAISDRINRRERPILISKSGLEDDRQCGGKYKAPITRWRSFARAHKARSNVDDEREALQWLCEKCNLQNVIEDHRCSRCLSHRAQEKAVWRKDDDDEYQQADDVAAAYSLGEEAPKGASGLSWQNVGESKPADGEELQNTELAMALESTSTFQSWEWDSFGIQGLRLDHYIRSGPCYFKPAEEDSEFVPVDALYCPSRFGRWRSFCHNPDLVVAHRMKGIEVYFTRTSAVIMSCQDRAVILREGSQEAETVPLPVAREFLNSSSVVLPGGSALRAVETSLQVLSRRKKLPQWQLPPAAGAVVDVSPPVSALAAIHLTLDAFPEEVHSQARDPRTMDVNNLAPSISSGSDETIISPEKVEIDLDDFKLLGQKWRNVGMAQPKRGKELTNSRLAEALMAKTEFSLEEWDEFCIESLRVDHFIKSGSFFFMPSAGMLRNSAFIHWKRPMPISLRKEANLDLGTAEDFP